MKTMKFEGHSDDTFGEYGVTKDDYDNCACGEQIAIRVKDEHGNGFVVVGHYDGSNMLKCQPPCWLIGIQPLDEGEPIPRWPMRWGLSDSGYSPSLEIDVPDSAVCEFLNREN